MIYFNEGIQAKMEDEAIIYCTGVVVFTLCAIYFMKDEYYDMTAKPKGICLIINNRTFEKSSTREGSEKDVNRLINMFESFDFTVMVKENVNRLLEYFKSFSVNEVKPEHSCFVCFISSHGFDNYILCPDEERVSIHKIIDFFSGSQCFALQGKPKMFFIQACRVSEKEPNTALESDVTFEKEIRRHKQADFLLFYATTSGSVAFRNKDHGSLFINQFVKILKKTNGDVLSILTAVNQVFSNPDKVGVNQMTNFESTLTKKVVLG